MAQNRSRRGAKAILLATTASLLLAGTALAQTAPTQTPRRFDIPAQDAAAALQTYARQTGRQILFRYDLVAGRRTPAIRGEYTDEQVLERLADAAGLVVTSNDVRTVTLQPRPQFAGQGEAPVLEDIVVTGTNIRGANPTAPVHVVTREDIDRSGYGTVGEVVRSLPENFAGGENPGHLGAGTSNGNNGNASTVNLRGLGDGATLVLLNGRRVPATSYIGSADISGIPLSAVSRVEVVTDGSSALYGSDAVAGVVNFITKKDYHGLEASARLGGATQGGAFEQTYSVLGGYSGGRWHGLLNVEYADQDGINANERDFLRGWPTQATIFRPERRTSIFATGGLDVTERLSVDLDALWNKKDSFSIHQTRSTSAPQVSDTDVEAYLISLGSNYSISDSYSLSLFASTAQNRLYRLTTTSNALSKADTVNANKSFGATLQGSIATLPSGVVKGAFGAGWREESWDRATLTTFLTGSRDLKYISGELLIPLVPTSEQRPGMNALELSISGRNEYYSDYGSTFTPKFGLRYVLFPDFSLRGTWGKSFKTPSIYQNVLEKYVQIQRAQNFGYVGTGTVLYASGGSEDLNPERSESWTIGADYHRTEWGNLRLAVTYFSIDYTDRVVYPINSASTALTNPAYAPFVILNPTGQQKADLISSADSIINSVGGTYNPNTVVAIVMNRYVNALSQKVQGVDLSYRQSFDWSHGSLSPFANATWLDIQQQTLASLPMTTLSGTIFNAPEFRVRAGATWESGPVALTGTLNYQSGSEDTGVTPSRHVASQVTTDASLAYRFPDASGPLANLQVTLAASNLFDLDPPYAQSPSALQDGLYFDTVNASAMGRYISLTLRKAF